MGLVFTALFFFSAPYIPAIYGIETTEIIDSSVTAARILAVSAVPYSLVFMAFNYYNCLGKPAISIFVSFLYNFLCPLALSIPLCMLFGFNGISLGMSVCAYVVTAVIALITRNKNENNSFPVSVEDYGEEAVVFNLYVDDASIVQLRDKVSESMTAHGFNADKVNILIEELYLRIKEKNASADHKKNHSERAVLSERTLLYSGDKVRIITRDNGVIFNFLDENNKIESLNSYVLNSFLEHVEKKDYMLTTSFNRNGFIFKKENL